MWAAERERSAEVGSGVRRCRRRRTHLVGDEVRVRVMVRVEVKVRVRVAKRFVTRQTKRIANVGIIYMGK